MSVVFRPARENELEQAEELVVRSINDLTERHGFGTVASSRPPQFQTFSWRDDPSGLWIAEQAGRILGFAFSWVCDDLWFLAELFVSPDQQGRGIGNELLKRTLHQADQAKVANKALITFAFNTASQGLYVRHGLLPRLPIYNLSVARELLQRRLQGAELRSTAIENEASHLDNLARIDARALGVSREKHHRYLMADKATKGALLYRGGDCVGYAYISPEGHIGPLAVVQPGDIDAAFRTALNLASQGASTQVSAFLPGATGALSIAVEHDMRIMFPMVLMSNRQFGNWTQYLPRNPGFM